MRRQEVEIWITPDEWTVVTVVWLLLFGGSLLAGGGLVWRARKSGDSSRK